MPPGAARARRSGSPVIASHSPVSLGLLYVPEAYSSSGAGDQIWGRQSAGAGFLRALADARPERVLCFTHPPDAADDFRSALARHGSPDTDVRWVGLHNLSTLAEAGLLYNPSPTVERDAWLRSRAASSDAWSICGVVHAIAGQGVMTAVAGWLTAPLQPWDAVVCTSRAVHDAVLRILSAQADFLAERLGATRMAPPRLPVIPLGVHAADYAFTAADRAGARAALGLAPGEVAALYVGRFSPFNKAHPAPMYLALEACAASRRSDRGGLALVEAGWFTSDADRAAFAADAAALCPSVRRIVVDGRDGDARRRAWAAADFFVSLSDSIQESFGLTPIEAMAAGLPVVVSDWDGYRDTVRDGVDGFRIPTWALPPGSGQIIADRYALDIDDYQGYLAIVGSAVAVDVAAAAEACVRLAADPELRRRMGEAGRARARAVYDWRVVFARYRDLWADLAEARRAAPDTARHRWTARPDRPDPTFTFADYPTATLTSGTLVRRAPGADLRTALDRRAIATMNLAKPALPAADVVETILGALSSGDWIDFSDLCATTGSVAVAAAPAALWLAKVGVLQLRPPQRGAKP